MKFSNLFGWSLKATTFIGIIGIALLAIGIEWYAFIKIANIFELIFSAALDGDVVVKKVLHTLDMILIGITLFTIAIMLYELFIDKINGLPAWLVISSMDELKGIIVKMIIVVLGISFTGKIITWDGQADLMGYGVAQALVIVSLSYFLVVKAKKEEA